MKILHVGATGLVGRLVLSRLLASAQVTEVIAPTRRPLDVVNPRLRNPVVDFEALPEGAGWWAVDGVVCTLGTTIAEAGSQVAFRRVDHDYPLLVARRARMQGANRFVLNSALGANARSSLFYNRVKGELEEALAALDYPSLVLVRPGLIDGERIRPRPGEGRALAVSRLLRPLLPMKWRPSRAGRIADALVAAVLHPPAGRHVVEADRLA
ncbi:MAG: NAD-dependent dehydratase [Lysobacteraceae bacterium]|nr:MAG: NAD-dependent dehydratase [Xanthomonadaceae bacterium]